MSEKENTKTQIEQNLSHTHTHSHEHTKEVSNRLARAIGHLQKVKQMVENGDDCSDVLIQLAAVKSALNNTGKVILKDHLDHCIVHAVDSFNIIIHLFALADKYGIWQMNIISVNIFKFAQKMIIHLINIRVADYGYENFCL